MWARCPCHRRCWRLGGLLWMPATVASARCLAVGAGSRGPLGSSTLGSCFPAAGLGALIAASPAAFSFAGPELEEFCREEAGGFCPAASFAALVLGGALAVLESELPPQPEARSARATASTRMTLVLAALPLGARKPTAPVPCAIRMLRSERHLSIRSSCRALSVRFSSL